MVEITPRLIGDSVILVGEREVGPSSSHMFALLLILALAGRGGQTRRELQDLLFEDVDDSTAPHRLRQLLYRLRGLGVILADEPTTALSIANPVAGVVPSPDDLARRLTTPGAGLDALRVLPHYSPRLPRKYLEWLDSTRELLDGAIRDASIAALGVARSRQDWTATHQLAAALLKVDPFNEEAARAGAEALAIAGRRTAALEMIDRFSRVTDDGSVIERMRKFRARIASLALPRREVTLRNREECFALLDAKWDRVKSSGGVLTTIIVGAAGMGKSRVAETYAAKVRLAKGEVVHHRCSQGTSEYPLALFSNLLPALRAMRGALGASPDYREVLDRLVPDTHAAAGELPSALELGAIRVQLQRALVDLLESVSTEGSLLMIIDDAHLLDEPSCSVLRMLSESEQSAIHVVALCRLEAPAVRQFSSAAQSSSYVLPPLDGHQSEALLGELSSGIELHETRRRWIVSQAAGNPFYLHALSRASSDDSENLTTQIQVLASTAYYSLEASERLVLESCLVLAEHASVARVAIITELPELDLLGPLRELEARDLVRMDGYIVRGPHAILHEALRQLIPTTVAAVISRRVARALAEECVGAAYTPTLAWAAVQAWIAAGEPRAAVTLAIRCAEDAATMGEPAAGADLLDRVPRAELPSDCQRDVLDALMQLADSGNCEVTLGHALQERLSLAIASRESADRIGAITISRIRRDLRYGGDPPPLIAPLENILRDLSVSLNVRTQAVTQLLVIADMLLDPELAGRAYSSLQSRPQTGEQEIAAATRAEMVFHSAFGDREKALALASALVDMFPYPSLERESRDGRNYAGFGLVRIGKLVEAQSVLEPTSVFMLNRGMLAETEYSLSILADIDISLGNFDKAQTRIEQIDGLPKQLHSRYHYGAYYSSCAFIAMQRGEYTRAHAAVDTLSKIREMATIPRLRAVFLATLLRLAQLTNTAINVKELTELRELYARGRRFGGQDTIVEALWVALRDEGDIAAASTLLQTYLVDRREFRPTEWSLRETTKDDRAWGDPP